MKKKPSFILIVCLLAAALHSAPARAEEKEGAGDAFSGVRLTAESLPEGMEITEGIRATDRQVLNARRKIGFPLTAVFNQTISYRGHQARVNYMAVPTDVWVEFGYSKLMGYDGHRSMVMAKGRTLIQLVATTKELEDRLILLLEVDQLQTHKIRFHRTPSKWLLLRERLLAEEEYAELELKAGRRIRGALEQKMIINRTAIKVTYLDCRTEQSADRVGRVLAKKDNPVVKRLVRSYGPIVVYADSSNSKLNERVLERLNW